jgi:hypothetical protein
MSQLTLVGIGAYMIGHGLCNMPNPGAFGMIAGGIAVIIAAFI